MSAEHDPDWGELSTTAWGILGLLSLQSWTGYELAQHAHRSLDRCWPLGESSLYAQPPKLEQLGLVTVDVEAEGKRTRKRYTITERGRAALDWWLSTPPAPPVMLNEPMLRMTFMPLDDDHADNARAAIAALRDWAADRQRSLFEVGQDYLTGNEPFPSRTQRNLLGGLLFSRINAAILEWAEVAQRLLDDDPTLTGFDGEAVIAEVRAVPLPD